MVPPVFLGFGLLIGFVGVVADEPLAGPVVFRTAGTDIGRSSS
jgi:hypothetical protein